MEDWQSDRMRWTRNPVYPFPGIGGLNPSSSAKAKVKIPQTSFCAVCGIFVLIIIFDGCLVDYCDSARQGGSSFVSQADRYVVSAFE